MQGVQPSCHHQAEAVSKTYPSASRLACARPPLCLAARLPTSLPSKHAGWAPALLPDNAWSSLLPCCPPALPPARHPHLQAGGEDGKLAALGLAGEAAHAHNVAALDGVHQLLKIGQLAAKVAAGRGGWQFQSCFQSEEALPKLLPGGRRRGQGRRSRGGPVETRQRSCQPVPASPPGQHTGEQALAGTAGWGCGPQGPALPPPILSLRTATCASWCCRALTARRT